MKKIQLLLSLIFIILFSGCSMTGVTLLDVPTDNNTGALLVNITDPVDIINNIYTGDYNIYNVTSKNATYGEMHLHNNTNAVSISITDTWYNISNFESGERNNINYSNSSLIITENGTYQLQHSGSYSGGANTNYETTLAVNGIIIEECEAERKLGVGGDVGNAGSHCVKTLSEGDQITMMVKNNDNTNNPTFTYASVNVFRLEYLVTDDLFTESQILNLIDERGFNNSYFNGTSSSYLYSSGQTVFYNDSKLNNALNELLNLSGGTMTGDINMGDNAITNVDYMDWDLTNGIVSQEGRMFWHEEDGTLNLGLSGGNVNLQIGLEQLIKTRNDKTYNILNGKVVSIDGATGNLPTIRLANASEVGSSFAAIGVATEDINFNSNGYITTQGIVRDLDTSLWVAGTSLYLGEEGSLTSTIPTNGDRRVFIAVVTRQHATEGEIWVKPIAVPYLTELSDIEFDTPNDGESLVYNATSGLFQFRTISGGSGTGDYSLPSIINSTLNYDNSTGDYLLVNTSNNYIEGVTNAKLNYDTVFGESGYLTSINFTSTNQSIAKNYNATFNYDNSTGEVLLTSITY